MQLVVQLQTDSRGREGAADWKSKSSKRTVDRSDACVWSMEYVIYRPDGIHDRRYAG